MEIKETRDIEIVEIHPFIIHVEAVLAMILHPAAVTRMTVAPVAAILATVIPITATPITVIPIIPVAVVLAAAAALAAVAVPVAAAEVLVVRLLRIDDEPALFFSEKMEYKIEKPNIKAPLFYFIPFCYNVWYYESEFAHSVGESC